VRFGEVLHYAAADVGMVVGAIRFDDRAVNVRRSRRERASGDADGCRFFGATRFCHLRNAAIFVLMRNCGTGGSRLVGH
jgi:hypothetical protein